MDLNTEKRIVITETQHITSICLSKNGRLFILIFFIVFLLFRN